MPMNEVVRWDKWSQKRSEDTSCGGGGSWTTYLYTHLTVENESWWGLFMNGAIDIQK